MCGIGTSCGELLEEVRIPTTEPGQTMEAVVRFFEPHRGKLSAIGIGSFGPIQLHRDAADFGFITTTPKIAWRHFDLAGTVGRAVGAPVAFDTDVNAAALGEATWGAARGLRTILYVTVGTGIGGGAIVEGSLLHGLLHPEMGHIRVPHDHQRDPFAGVCPYHGDCLEGLACGKAIEERWGTRGETLAADHPAWELEAEYLAYACTNWICTLSVQKLVMGGGVMQPHLYGRVRRRVVQLLNGYFERRELTDGIDELIVPAALGGRAGLMGALALAMEEAHRGTSAGAPRNSD